MATWNTNVPTITNTVSADISDIRENLNELKDIVEGITNGTVGTTEPAAFEVDQISSAPDYDGTSLSASASEINTLCDGATTNATEVNMLDGATAIDKMVGSDESLSSSSGHTFTGLVAAKRYRIEFELGNGSTSNLVYIRFGNSGGVDSGSNYNYRYSAVGTSSNSVTNQTGQTQIVFGGHYLDANDSIGELYFSTALGDDTKVLVCGTTVGGGVSVATVGGSYDGASTIDRVQILPNTGTFDGRVRLYQLN
jgi:hypothetical protein